MADSCDPMDYSLPGSSVHGILQARILEWVTISFFWGSFQELNPSLLHCRQILYQLSYQEALIVPRSGIKSVSLAVEDGFLTIGPPGKSFNAFMDSFIYPTYNIFAECLLYVRCKMVIDMILAPVDFTETPVNLKFHCRIVLFVGKKKVYYGNKIPWMEKPGSLQPMGSQRVGHD